MAITGESEDDDALRDATFAERIGNELVKSYGFGRNPDGSWDWSIDRIGKSFQDDPIWTTLDWLSLGVPVLKWGASVRAVTRGSSAIARGLEAGAFAGRAAKGSGGFITRQLNRIVSPEVAAAAEMARAGPSRLALRIGGRSFGLSNPITTELSDDYLDLVRAHGGEWWENRAVGKALDRERILGEAANQRMAQDLIGEVNRAGLDDRGRKSFERIFRHGLNPETQGGLILKALGGNEAAARAYKNTYLYRQGIHEASHDLGLISEEAYTRGLQKGSHYSPRIYEEWTRIKGAADELTPRMPIAGRVGEGAARFQKRADDAIYTEILDPRASIHELGKAGQTIARQRFAQGISQSVVAHDLPVVGQRVVDILQSGNERLMKLHGITGKTRDAVRALLPDLRAVGRPANVEKAVRLMGWKPIDELLEAPGVKGYIGSLPATMRGKWIDPLAAQDVVGGLKILGEPTLFTKLYDRILGTFRASKTAYNPATQVRNGLGNIVFHHLVTGGVPTLAPRKGLKSWLAGDELYEAFREAGGLDGSFTAETRDALRDAFAGVDQFTGKSATAIDWLGSSKVARVLQGGAGKAEEAYRAMDEWWKLDAWIQQAAKYQKAGMAKEVARKAALADVFKFMPNFAMHSDLTNAVRKGVPFASFTGESLRTWKNVLQEKPHLAFFWNHAFESMGEAFGAMAGFDPSQIDEAKKALPEYVQGKKMTILPFNVDGQPRFLDLSYMMPLGNIAEMQTSEKLFFLELVDPTTNPLLNAAAAAATGVDPFTQRQIEPQITERQLGIPVTGQNARHLVGLAEHMAAMMLPPLVPPGYAGINLLEAARGQANPSTGEPLEDGVLRTILANVAGFRTYAPDVESQVLNVRREERRRGESIGQAWDRWEFAHANGKPRAMEEEAARIVQLRMGSGYTEGQALQYFRESAAKRGPFANLSKRQLRDIAARAKRLGELSPEQEQLRRGLERRAVSRG